MMMQPIEPARPLGAEQVLDQVYAAMLISDYGALPALTAELEKALQRQAKPSTEAEVQMIRRKAERNAAVLLAAQRGIKAARRRLADIRASSSSFVTYDRSGRRAEVVETRNLTQRL
jgi:hypothetical protein